MRMHDHAVRLRETWLDWDWYVKHAARWLRARLWWGPIFRLMDRPLLCRRLPHWLLRTVVRGNLLIVQQVADQVRKEHGTLSRPYARQRVRGWTDSRAKVLAQLDLWVSTMVEVRAELQS